MFSRDFSKLETRIISKLPDQTRFYWMMFIDHFPITNKKKKFLTKLMNNSNHDSTILGYMVDQLMSVASSLDIPNVYLEEMVEMRRHTKRLNKLKKGDSRYEQMYRIHLKNLQERTILLLRAVIMRINNHD